MYLGRKKVGRGFKKAPHQSLWFPLVTLGLQQPQEWGQAYVRWALASCFPALGSTSPTSLSYSPKLIYSQLKTSPKLTAGKGGVKSALLLEMPPWWWEFLGLKYLWDSKLLKWRWLLSEAGEPFKSLHMFAPTNQPELYAANGKPLEMHKLAAKFPHFSTGEQRVPNLNSRQSICWLYNPSFQAASSRGLEGYILFRGSRLGKKRSTHLKNH